VKKQPRIADKISVFGSYESLDKTASSGVLFTQRFNIYCFVSEVSS